MLNFFSKNNYKSISVNDLDNLLGKINLIDIRETYEYRNGHLPTAKNIPMNNLLAEPENFLDETKEYHIICQSGGRSSRACTSLISKGYNVINVAGGTGSYRGNLQK